MENYVLIPTRNIDVFLLKTVKSIKNSGETLEIVIGFDNGHVDQSVVAKLEELEVAILESPSAVPSVHSVLNFSLKSLFKSQPIFRMDADDLWVKGRSQHQSQIHGNHDAVASNMSFINSAGLAFPNLKYSFDNGIFSYPILLFSNVICHPTIYFVGNSTREVVYPDNAAEDYALWLDWIVKGRTIFYSNKKVIKYRMHSKQVSRNFNRNESQLFELYDYWIRAAGSLNIEALPFENFVALQCREHGCNSHKLSSSHIIGLGMRLLRFYREDSGISKSYRNRLIQELFVWSIFHKEIVKVIVELHKNKVPIAVTVKVLSRTLLHGVLVSIFVKRK